MPHEYRHVGKQVAPDVVAAYQKAAREDVAGNPVIQIREDAMVSPLDNSAQVQAWFWMEGTGTVPQFRQGAEDHYAMGEAIMFTPKARVSQVPGEGAWVEGWVLVQGAMDTAPGDAYLERLPIRAATPEILPIPFQATVVVRKGDPKVAQTQLGNPDGGFYGDVSVQSVKQEGSGRTLAVSGLYIPAARDLQSSLAHFDIEGILERALETPPGSPKLETEVVLPDLFRVHTPHEFLKRPEWIQDKGALGGPGFLTQSNVATQRRLLTASLRRDGYRTTLGRLLALERSRALRSRFGARLRELREWLVVKYGGLGSFGPRVEKLPKAPLGGHGEAEVRGIGSVDYRWTYKSGDGVVMINDSLRNRTIPIPIPESARRYLADGRINDHVEDQIRQAVEADIRYAQEQKQFKRSLEEEWILETGDRQAEPVLEPLPAGHPLPSHDDPAALAEYEAWTGAENAERLERLPAGSAFTGPTSVQTILFDRERFSKQQAKDWARDHKFRYGKVDMKPNRWRLRQYDPTVAKKGTFRTKTIAPGVQFVFAVKRGARFAR